MAVGVGGTDQVVNMAEGEKGLYSEENERSNDYSKFNALTYLRTRYSNPNEERNEFYLRKFHEFYQKYHSHWDATNTRLLEYGGGPVIIPLISAAPFVSEIVFAEYAESCRKEVQLWKDNSPDAHNWTPYFHHVVNKLEGNAESGAAAAREHVLRSRISSVIPCNINADEQFILGSKGGQQPFDIISLNGCIEAAVKSHSDYQNCLAKLKGLLKAGGLLIGVAFLGSSWYEVHSEQFQVFPLTEEFVVSSFQQTGFTFLEKTTESITTRDSMGRKLSGAASLMFIVAELA